VKTKGLVKTVNKLQFPNFLPQKNSRKKPETSRLVQCREEKRPSVQRDAANNRVHYDRTADVRRVNGRQQPTGEQCVFTRSTSSS
jgi:hypothetical protein